jgi:hypothetical protein
MDADLPPRKMNSVKSRDGLTEDEWDVPTFLRKQLD